MLHKDKPVFKKIVLLDYLRGVAILFIVFYHYVLEVTLFHIRPELQFSYAQNIEHLRIFHGDGVISGLGNLLVFASAQGYQFVGVFIFLSGFGLTYSKMVKGGKPWLWIRRIIRLIPQFQIAIVFAFIVNYFSLHYLRRYLVAVPNAHIYPYLRLLLYPLVWKDFYSLISKVNPSLWFSGLILQYYVVYDFLYWVLLKMKAWWFLILTLILTVIYRYLALFYYNGDPFLFSLLPVRLFEFGLGMGAAYIFVEGPYNLFSRFNNWIVWGGGALLWYLGFRLGYSINGRIVNDILTTVGLVMICVVTFRHLKSRWLKVLIGAIGLQSYWIYLLHNQLVTQLLTPWTFMQWDKSGMSGLTLLLGVAVIVMVCGVFSMILCYYGKYAAYFTKPK